MMHTVSTNPSVVRKENLDSNQHLAFFDTTLTITSLPALMLLDRDGFIYSCSEEVAALACLTPQQLLGQPVKRLLPALPMSAETRGYNVAFTVFQATSGCAPIYQMMKSNGNSIAVIVLLKVLKTDPEYLFSLEMRECSQEGTYLPEASSRWSPAWQSRTRPANIHSRA